MKKYFAISRNAILWCFVFLLLASAVHARTFVQIQNPVVKGDADIGFCRDCIEAGPVGGNFMVDNCGEIVIQKNLDIASPLLFSGAANGTIYGTIKIFLVDLSGSPTSPGMEMTLTGAKITSIHFEGDVEGEEPPTEIVSFKAESIEVKVIPIGNANPVVATVTCKKEK